MTKPPAAMAPQVEKAGRGWGGDKDLNCNPHITQYSS